MSALDKLVRLEPELITICLKICANSLCCADCPFIESTKACNFILQFADKVGLELKPNIGRVEE